VPNRAQRVGHGVPNGPWLPCPTGAVTTDRKMTCRKWARGSGPGLGAVIGPGQVGYGLHGLGQGYCEAESLDLLDVVLQLVVDIDAGLVVAGAEVGEPGPGVTEQVPDDDQDGAGDGDLGLLLAAAAGDRVVPLAEEGLGAGAPLAA
jgi:hypothetical protein